MESKQTDTRPFMKTGEAARLLGVQPSTVRAAVVRGDLPGIQLGTMTLISRAPLMRLLAQLTETPSQTV